MRVDRHRFAAGWRLVPDRVVDLALADELDLAIPGRPRPSIVVDVVRPSDLVSLTFAGYDLELVSGARAHLRPIGDGGGRLVVRLAWQHLGERAIYEGQAPVPDETKPHDKPVPDTAPIDGEGARPNAPIDARPARGSRLVLTVAPGTTIAFSTAGLLRAIEQLPMEVHPLAAARPVVLDPTVVGPVFHLPGGLVATATAAGVTIAAAPRGMAIPDAGTAIGMAALARDVRRVREILVRQTATGQGLDRLRERARLVDSDLVVELPRRIRPLSRPRFSRPAGAFETAIEAPYRLTISPSAIEGWTHATEPVAAEGAPHRVELWHTRLGVRREAPPNGPDDAVTIDERADSQRIVRAVWARDRERFPQWQTPLGGPTHDDSPFRTSLDGSDRHVLVRQSAETWRNARTGALLAPRPVDVEALHLSSLGAWLDLHGQWDSRPYSAAALASILSWDHVAPMGRDQFVRVVYPGYLYPFGHRTTLVKLTERKMKDAAPSAAGLYQRKFLVVGEPMRRYDQRDLPFQEVTLAPLVTPTLSPDPGAAQDTFFFPFVDGQPFEFVLHCVDREGRKVRLVAPLMWVAEHFSPFAQVDHAYTTVLPGADDVPADGQDVAFAPVDQGGDTVLPTTSMLFGGRAALGTSTPRLRSARVRIKAAEQFASVGDQTITYAATYLTNGFEGANIGHVWAELPTPTKIEFGGPAAPSDRAGGFVQPTTRIAGISRSKGTVGDVASAASGGFDPTEAFKNAMPKLFGLVELADLLAAVGLDLSDAPNVVSEALDRVEGFMADLVRAKAAVTDAVDDAQQRLANAQASAAKLIAEGRAALAAEITATAQAALSTATGLKSNVMTACDAVIDGIASVPEALSEGDVEAALTAPLAALGVVAGEMRAAANALPPLAGHQLRTLADALDEVAGAADVIHDVFQFVNGLATSAIEGRFRYEWRPRMRSWPDGDPILELQERSLVLAVDGRVQGKSAPRVEVLAELRDFSLNLLPGETLVRFKFDHISFRAGSTGKAEVDVVMNDIEFVGLLGFIETLKDLIPFDGFSDPPFVDVSSEGITAGFTLALPNVAIGVFSLSNMSLGADVRVPFLGDVVTVGFNFCTRERPFTLAVLFIGGGGWFLIRLSPDGLDVLELGLEAGATLSIDLGVASGSISAMIGVYMRLEGDAGSLTAYFRLRGEVDVLGLISASIELYLSLTYDFPTGKLVGRAQLTIKVEVLFFSASVTIECERRFAGSNGDPTFVEVMGVQPDLTSPAWTDYCLAFAGA
jgi:hypothetical protein